MSDILTARGYQVDVASHGHVALALVKDKAYPLVLLHYKIPDMDGLELFRHIQRLRPGGTGVVVTAFAASDMREASSVGRDPADSGEARGFRYPVATHPRYCRHCCMRL
jgi:CheY-like chemotaxis protein